MFQIQKDKQLHFGYSAIISLLFGVMSFIMGMNIIQTIFTAMAVSSAAGYGKEYGDHLSPSNHWDWKDIIADTLGSITGTSISLLSFLI